MTDNLKVLNVKFHFILRFLKKSQLSLLFEGVHCVKPSLYDYSHLVAYKLKPKRLIVDSYKEPDLKPFRYYTKSTVATNSAKLSIIYILNIFTYSQIPT